MYIGLDMKEVYENMNGNTAALYTYIYNLDFSMVDIEELRDRIVVESHSLDMNGAGEIEEFDSDGDFYATVAEYHA